jgi:hypothetical protein
MRATTNTCNILVGYVEGKKHVRPRSREEDNIKKDFR